MRAYLIRVNEIQNYYARQLREASSLNARDQIAFAAAKGSSAIRLLRRALFRGVSEPAPINGTADAVATAFTAAEQRRSRINELYDKAVDAYVPRRYSGRVTVLQPKEWIQEHMSDPTFGWRDVVRGVDVRTIPGGHLSCITDHVEALASCLKECLGSASAELTFTCERNTPASAHVRV